MPAVIKVSYGFITDLKISTYAHDKSTSLHS